MAIENWVYIITRLNGYVIELLKLVASIIVNYYQNKSEWGYSYIKYV